MKRSLCRLAIGLSAVVCAFAQGAHFYKSADHNVTLRYGPFQFTQLSDGTQRYVMSGGVVATSVTEGLKLSSQRATAWFAPGKKTTTFRTLDAEGDVHLLKSAKSSTGSRSTLITAPKGRYETGPVESTATLAGPVHIVDRDETAGRILSIEGSSGVAKLLSGTTSKASPLRSANLKGPIQLDIAQAPKKGETKPGQIHATGDALRLDAVHGQPTITLQGHVLIHGKGAALDGDMGEFQSVVLRLNAKRQVSNIDSGGG